MSTVESAWASLDVTGGQAVLRLERKLAHPVEKVWRAITNPAELVHWFPARIDAELKPGATMRFTFDGDGESTTGEVIEFDPPKVFAFSWNSDVLRFELVPAESGCLLYFTHVHSEQTGGRRAAGRNAAGWDACFASLEARLGGAGATKPESMLDRMAAYIERFGLGEGEVRPSSDGSVLRFERDLAWQPLPRAFAILIGQDCERYLEPGAAAPLPATHDYLTAGPVTEVQPPHVLAYDWLHDGAAAGTVRFEFTADPQAGHRVVLTQTVPAALAYVRATALAAWHTHLELFFAALFGEDRPPWPAARTEQLSRMYADRLGSLGELHAAADGRFALRFERMLAHPPERVWQALTDAGALRAWFPAMVDIEQREGAPLRFELTEEAKLRFALPDEQATAEGEITALERHRVLAYTWADELLRWELTATGQGCLLVFTTVFGSLEVAADQGAAWHAALEMLEACLDGRDADWSQWERAEQLAADYADIGHTIPAER